MTEELKPSKVYSTNPVSVARRLARQKASEEKRQNAADLQLAEQESESGRHKTLRAQWKANLAALSDKDRSSLNSAIDEWNYFFDAMSLTAEAIRQDQPYGSDMG